MTHHRPMPDTNGWPPFTLAWDDNLPGLTDMAHLLARPAGATGFIQRVDGHLATGDGQRWRIWGQHLVRSQPLPPMDLAPIIARRLAKFGINCIRLHAIDFHWPDGILMRHTDCSRSLDPEALARLDWMIACLKAQGIYVDINLHVARRFTAADKIKGGDSVGWGKPVLYFDDWLIGLQKEYARQLLHHRNPFTGLHYCDEPAVALIEITNENSLSEHWQAGWLKGSEIGHKENWGDIHPLYAQQLDQLWNRWLARRYPQRQDLAAAWADGLDPAEDATLESVRRLQPADFAAASAGRFHDEALFYNEIEQSFFGEMRSFLRDDLGVQQLILGTADHNAKWSGLPVVKANTMLDITASHFYWQHPVDGKIDNTPMVDQPDRCAIAHLSRGAVQGFPHLCTETNQPFPGDTAAEFIPILAAYARLQDWDGVFFYDFQPWTPAYWRAETWSETRQHYWFDMANNPVKMAQIALGSLMFLRGDAQTAQQTIERAIPQTWALESIRQHTATDREHPYWLPHLPGRLALTHRTRIVDFDATDPIPTKWSAPTDPIVSDTGELTWETTADDGRVLIDTPRQQAIIGRAGTRATRNLLLKLATLFAAVQLASLDGAPIADSAQMLLLLGTRIANTDQTWTDESRQQPADWGHAPVRIEPIAGNLTLCGLNAARQVTAQALDGHGQPHGEEINLAATAAGFVLDFAALVTSVWYVVRVNR